MKPIQLPQQSAVCQGTAHHGMHDPAQLREAEMVVKQHSWTAGCITAQHGTAQRSAAQRSVQ